MTPLRAAELDNPFHWMDTIDRQRAAEAAAVPTVPVLADRIRTFYDTQGVTLGRDEATQAARTCLAEVAPRVLDWPRPATVMAWTAAQAKQDRSIAWRQRAVSWIRRATGTLLTLASLSLASIAGYHEPTFLSGCGLVVVCAILLGGVSLIGWGVLWLFTEFFVDHARDARRQLDPAPLDDDDVAALRAALAVPAIARALQAIRHSGVPLLVQDKAPVFDAIEADQAQRQAAAEALAQQACHACLADAIDTSLARSAA